MNPLHLHLRSERRHMDRRKFGYARTYTVSQSLDQQLFELQKYVKKEFIVIDKMCGSDSSRKGYQSLKGNLGLRRGDTLYIKSLDCLSRSKIQLNDELHWFREHGIRLIVFDLPTTMIEVPDGQTWILDMVNNILLEVISYIAADDRAAIQKRKHEGIDSARCKEKHLGRPAAAYPDQWDNLYQKWKRGEITASYMMKALNLKKTSFYKMVKNYSPTD